MSDAVVISYETRPEQADSNAKLVAEVYAQLHAEGRPGLRYATFRLADSGDSGGNGGSGGNRFVHVAVVEEGSPGLPGLAAFEAFRAGLEERLLAPLTRSQATLVGAYGFGNP